MYKVKTRWYRSLQKVNHSDLAALLNAHAGGAAVAKPGAVWRAVLDGQLDDLLPLFVQNGPLAASAPLCLLGVAVCGE